MPNLHTVWAKTSVNLQPALRADVETPSLFGTDRYVAAAWSLGVLRPWSSRLLPEELTGPAQDLPATEG